PAEEALGGDQRALALLVPLAPAGPAAPREGAAHVGAHLVDGADEAWPRLDSQRRTASLVEAHVAAVAEEVGERSRMAIHAIPVAAEDAPVRRERGEAARPAGGALRGVFPHRYSRTSRCVRDLSSSSHLRLAFSRISVWSRWSISCRAAS